MQAIIGEDGNLSQVKCIICSKMEGHDKLLVAKIDGVYKQVGRNNADKKDFVLGKKQINKGVLLPL